MARQLTDIDGELVDETTLAWLFVSDGQDAKHAVWIPKSLSEWEPKENKVDGTMTVPVWFAEKEGLL